MFITVPMFREHTVFFFMPGCCAALTQLSLNDTNAQNIVHSNGVYILGKLILPLVSVDDPEERELLEMLQKSALRALRFLFSMERNRQLFKRQEHNFSICLNPA